MRALFLAATLAGMLVADDTAQAGWREYCAEAKLHRARVDAWPEPFIHADRELVRTPFRIMADNGWKLQNTLGHHLFDRETNLLNYAGKLKLHWIMTQIPPHRRHIYVLEGATPEETVARVASVYQGIVQVAPGQDACGIMTTKIGPPRGDGSYLNQVDRSFKSSVPQPRLRGAGGSAQGFPAFFGGSGTSQGQ
jgi:hypothetical protein